MNYRELGRTGLMVSEIGLGCEGFVDHDGELVEPLLNAAEQAGVNCLDLYSPDPEMRSRLGRALKGRRRRVIRQAQLCPGGRGGCLARVRARRDALWDSRGAGSCVM